MARGVSGARGRASTGLPRKTRRYGQSGARTQLFGELGRSDAGKRGGKTHSLKNQIRNIERLLHKSDLDPRARSKQVAVSEALQAALAKHQRAELERKYAVRYHKIRFFERVKLERQIRHANKALANGSASSEDTARQARLQDDLQYVMHFPRGEKYVSILKQADSAEAQAILDAERSRLRALVRQQLAEAAMLAEPDEGISLPARSATAPVDGTAISGNAPDEFFLQDGDMEDGAHPTDWPGHGTSYLPAESPSEAKHASSKGSNRRQWERPFGNLEDIAAKKRRVQGSSSQQGRQFHCAVEAERPGSKALPDMPQRYGIHGPAPVTNTQKGLSSSLDASPHEDDRAGCFDTAGGSHHREGHQVKGPGVRSAAENRAFLSTRRAGPSQLSAGRASVGVGSAVRQHVGQLPLRQRAEGGRKRRKKSQ